MSRNTTNRNSIAAPGRTRTATAVALVLAAGLLGGCVSNGQNGYGMKQGAGTLLGAGLGGLAGSQFGGGKGQLAMVAAGTLLGGFLGNEVGASLDRADQAYLNRAQGAAMNTGDWQTVTWSNPDSGNSGSFTPVRTVRNTQTGTLCREYSTTVTIGGRTQEGYGTACRDVEGNWRIQS